jgi:hypothetical protein
MKDLPHTPVKFGLIGTGIHIFIFFIYYFIGANPLIEMYTIDIFILPVFLYFGIREYRDYNNNKLLSFGQGMTAGLILYVLIATLTAVFAYFFLEYGDSGLMESYVQNRITKLTGNEQKIIEEMGQASYDESLNQLKVTTSKTLALDNFLKRIAIGFLLTSIISMVMKRKQK